jgi:hypothetical protein
MRLEQSASAVASATRGARASDERFGARMCVLARASRVPRAVGVWRGAASARVSSQNESSSEELNRRVRCARGAVGKNARPPGRNRPESSFTRASNAFRAFAT